ncbi:MAG: hypothetical protein JST54_28860, partial [Deltaproteobacteria bacterium]|nr:hypothetical protein [Deltaproteobacteria bacterium]
MFTFRCTRKLLFRLGAEPVSDAPTSTTRLGDWYGNIYYTRSAHLVVAVSASTLLPVIVPAVDTATVIPRLAVAAGEVMRAIGIPEATVSAELREMQEGVIAKTASRKVLGSLNEFMFMAGHAFSDGTSPHEVSLWLAKTPCTPLGGRYPI